LVALAIPPVPVPQAGGTRTTAIERLLLFDAVGTLDPVRAAAVDNHDLWPKNT
jgi:hypothetical protein